MSNEVRINMNAMFVLIQLVRTSLQSLSRDLSKCQTEGQAYRKSRADDVIHDQHGWDTVTYEEGSWAVVWFFVDDEDLNHMKSTCSMVPCGPRFVFSSCWLQSHYGSCFVLTSLKNSEPSISCEEENWLIYFPLCIMYHTSNLKSQEEFCFPLLL